MTTPLIDLATRIESHAPGNPELGSAKEFLHFVDRRIKIVKKEQDAAAKKDDFKEVKQAMSQLRILNEFRKKTVREIEAMEAGHGSSTAMGWTAFKQSRRKRKRRKKKHRTARRRKGSRRKKSTKKRRRAGQNSPTWIIRATPQAVSEFEQKIFNNEQYNSAGDEEARAIMQYLNDEVNNTDDDVWYIMKYDGGFWYPGQVIGYAEALSECSLPCFQVDNTSIRPVLKRATSRGNRIRKKRQGSKKRRR